MFLVVDLEAGTEYVTEQVVIQQPALPVLDGPTGPCCPVVRCKFAPVHTAHWYRDEAGSEGRCPGGGCAQ